MLEADDPLVVELREEILASCQPDVLLERSAEILLALMLNAEGEEYGTSAVDALEEILAEALTRGRLELAVQLLATPRGSPPAGRGPDAASTSDSSPGCRSDWEGAATSPCWAGYCASTPATSGS